MKIQEILNNKREIVDRELELLVPAGTVTPSVIHDAMRYSLFAGGKRIRPILCLLTEELFNEPSVETLRCACSLELLHTYTLIHDDLPCMDNDDLRRGKPTLHKVYGENIALLAGDALLTLTFSLIANNTMRVPEKGIQIINDFSELAGSKGLIGGQVLDLLSEKKDIVLKELEEIHFNKTAKLIMASVHMGAILGGAEDEEFAGLSGYAKNIGHAFQIADDILDETGDVNKMGKNPGQDKKLHKATYPKFFGIEKSKSILKQTIETAVSFLAPFGKKADLLTEVAYYIGSRDK